MKMQKYQNAGKVNLASEFSSSLLPQSDICIPASGSVRYRWSWISQASASYEYRKTKQKSPTQAFKTKTPDPGYLKNEMPTI
jgi:hypothetical protein